MPLRPTMLPLIQYTRDLVGEADSDACSCTSLVSDDQIQSALDDTRCRVRYDRLEPLETILPGGLMAWLDFESDAYFEDDVQLLDGDYTPIPADQIASIDALRGEYSFVDSRPLGCLIRGTRYDPYLAAANLLRSLRASNKLAVDSADANLKQSLSQMIANMKELEADYRRSARIGSISFCRSDIASN